MCLPFSIHRPMEVLYEGGFDLAERYDAVPVSGCIPGSLNSRVQYDETDSEARQQSVNVTISRTFSQSESTRLSQDLREGINEGSSSSSSLTNSEWEGESLQEGHGLSYSESAANNVGLSSSDGENWGWDLSEGESNEDYESRMADVYGEASVSGKVGVKGEGSVPGFAKVSGSVETAAGVTVGARTGGSSGTRARTSTSQGYGMGGTNSNTQNFGSTVAEGQTESVNGSYALSSQRTQTTRNEDSLSQGRSWSFGSGVALDEVVSQDDRESLSETWVETNVTTLRQGFSATIPRNRVGIFYRQTTRWVRRAEVRTYDLCGLAKHAGELQFNEWTWAPDLAIGATCDIEPPPSNMPEARCFIPPCGG